MASCGSPTCRLRGTGLTGVTRVAPSDDGERLLVTDEGTGREVVHAYDVRTGERVDTPARRSPSPERPRVEPEPAR